MAAGGDARGRDAVMSAGTRGPLDRAQAMLGALIAEPPEVGLVLGSGLGNLADAIDDAVRIDFSSIPGFARPTVAGHRGVLVAGRLEDVNCIALQGRFHLYEGYSEEAVAFPIRLLIRLGIHTLIVTNAAGGINARFDAGDIMIIDDHINLLWRNPLIGRVRDGEQRFPDLSSPYDPVLQDRAERVGLELGVRTHRGVYCAVLGPSYETIAEVRMLQRLGADAVGMSTVPEVLVARAAGVRVLGISLIANQATGLRRIPLSHEEVVQAAEAAGSELARLVRGVLRTLATERAPAA
jgi:purine-nucleoside phosphorylase